MTGFTMFLIFPEVWKGGLPVPIDTHIVYCKANACTHVLYTFLLSRFQPVKRLAVSVGFALRKVDQTTSGTAVSSTHFSLCASFRIIPNKFIATSSAILLHVCAQKWHAAYLYILSPFNVQGCVTTYRLRHACQRHEKIRERLFRSSILHSFSRSTRSPNDVSDVSPTKTTPHAPVPLPLLGL